MLDSAGRRHMAHRPRQPYSSHSAAMRAEWNNPTIGSASSIAGRLDLPTFLRMFQMRKGQIMWFLGAGASRAAGIKAGGDKSWELKPNLFSSEKTQPTPPVPD